ncbi:MAG: PQQ-binding-like beta-propeller repeat protein [Acidobacteriota bacterium]|nr:PQQ-binding-like beta-propeller repeat protein [Acidobacteriota bacterium]
MTKIDSQSVQTISGSDLTNKRRGIFQMRNPMLAVFASVFFTILGSSVPARAQNFFKSGASPSFSAAQAERGKTAYANSCANCHGSNLDDGEFGPPLKGTAFQQKWGAQSPAALFSYMLQKMPPTNPGQLGSQEYADLEAYVLQANGAAAGATELTAAELGSGVSAQASPAAKPQFQRDVFPSRGNRDAIYQAEMARRAAKLEKLTPVTDEVLQNPSDADWLMWRRTYSGLGFSPLDQIKKANVNDLRLAWSRALPLSANEITPLVHDGVLFVESGSTIQAIDGATGDLLWQYARALPDVLLNGSDSVMRGMAMYQDKLFAPTADGHIVALDVKTGKVVWDREVVTPLEGVYAHSNHDFRLDGAPIVVHGKVIAGVSLGITNQSGGCYIVGLDANTGDEVWRFHNIARPGQPGGDSWNGAPVNERYGASVWTSGSYDSKLNLVYFGTGNTYDVSTLLQPHRQQGDSNDGLYTDSTVALDPDTGKLAWYYQHMNRDVWDLDWAFEQLLLTLPVNGKPTDLLVSGGKMAIFDAVDRADGTYKFSKDLGMQNLVRSIDPKTGKKIIDPKFEPVANKTEYICPNANGARNWPASSYNPVTHVLYVGLAEVCMDYTWAPRDAAETAAGGLDIRFDLRTRPDSDSKMGRIDAVNLETRKIVWMDRQRAPSASAMLATAGGLLFSGAQNREFTARDAATGKILWQAGLNAAPSSYPITYEVNGKEYVAVVSGGGGPLDAGNTSLAPELNNTAGGATLWIFALPRADASAR